MRLIDSRLVRLPVDSSNLITEPPSRNDIDIGQRHNAICQRFTACGIRAISSRTTPFVQPKPTWFPL